MRRIAPKSMRGLAVKADRSAAAIRSASYVRRPQALCCRYCLHPDAAHPGCSQAPAAQPRLPDRCAALDTLSQSQAGERSVQLCLAARECLCSAARSKLHHTSPVPRNLLASKK